jgi:hypothetical protein
MCHACGTTLTFIDLVDLCRSCLRDPDNLDINIFLHVLERLSITTIFGYYCQGVRSSGIDGFSLPRSMISILLEHVDRQSHCTADVIWDIVGLIFETLQILFNWGNGGESFWDDQMEILDDEIRFQIELDWSTSRHN